MMKNALPSLPRFTTVRMRLAALALLSVALGAAPALAAANRDVIGSSHIAGRYSFTQQDYLNEGADQLLTLGTRVIKVWLSFEPRKHYPFHSHWGPPAHTLVQSAASPYFRALFAKPFTTFILIVNTGSSSIDDGFTAEDIVEERSRMYELASYLLRTYAGSGKTFVLQNWEGDHVLRARLTENQNPDAARVRGMIDWFNARQQGVERARREAGDAGVTVAHAIELNLLTAAMQGKGTITNDVLPHVRPDLISYSSWDAKFDPNNLVRALDYLGAHARPSALYGDHNIYIGEYGVTQEQLPPGVEQATVIRDLTEAALGWGVRYVVYWQLYSNEDARAYKGRPQNDDVHSLWLIRPDGTKTPMWEDFARRMPLALARAALVDETGRALSGSSPVDGGDGALVAYSRRLGPWSTFTLHGAAGAALHDGDRVTLQAHDGRYVGADGHGGLRARDRRARSAQVFVLQRVAGAGVVGFGDAIRLGTPSGLFLYVDPASTRVALDLQASTLRFLAQDAYNASPAAGSDGQ